MVKTISWPGVLLHPDRMRIAGEFNGRRGLTVTELGKLLPEMPPASLYRHVALLKRGGILAVAATHAKRGATEKTYRLAVRPMFSLDDVAASPKRLLQIVQIAAASLIHDFARYVKHADLRKRSVDPMIRSYAVFATDDEFRRLSEQLNQLAYDAGKTGAASPEGRMRRIFYIAAIPESELPT